MRSECCGNGGSRGAWGSGLGLVLGIAAVLLPKCPLCLAAYLSVVGIGAAATRTIAPFVYPVGIAMIVLSVVMLVVALRAGRRRTSRS